MSTKERVWQSTHIGWCRLRAVIVHAVVATSSLGMMAACAPVTADQSQELAAAIEVGAERDLDRPDLGLAPGEIAVYEVVRRGDGYLVAWNDARTSFGVTPAPLMRAYAARLDGDGTVIDGTGFPVMPQDEGVFASISKVTAGCADDDRCLIVAQREQQDVIGVRVTAGQVLDPEPLVLAAGPTRPRDISVAWDGQAFRIAWAGSDGVFSARVTADGQLDAPLLIGPPVVGEYSFRTRIACQRPRCLVTWSVNLGGGEAAVRASVVDPSGAVTDAFVVNDEAGRQWWAETVWDGTRYWVVFLDEPDPAHTGHGITAVRIDPSGTVLDPYGIEVAPPNGERDAPTLGHDGTHAIVLWGVIDSVGTLSLSGNRIAADGTVVEPVEVEIGAQHAGALQGVRVACRDGACLAAWSQGWYFRSDVRASRLAGLTEIDTAGIDISTSPPGQADAAATFGGGRYLVAWQDSRTSLQDPRVSTIHGSLFSPAMLEPVPFAVDPAAPPDPRSPCPYQGEPSVSASSRSYLVTWHEACTYYDNIYAQVVGADSGVAGPTFAVDIAALAQTRPATASSGDQFLVVWERQLPSPLPRSIEARRFDPAGAALGPERFTVTSNGVAPAIAFDGSNYVVVWQRGEATSSSRKDLFAARVSPDGTVLDPPEIAVAQVASRAEDAQSIACGGGVCLVVWRAGATSIMGSRMAVDGTMLDPAGFRVAAVTAVATDTSVAYDGQSFTVTWRTGSGELRGAEVSIDGTVLPPGDVPIASTSPALVRPVVVSDGAGHVLALYDRFDPSPEYRVRRVRARTLAQPAEPVDAGVPDATPAVDAGVPDATPAVDAGVPDATPAVDAGVTDAAPAVDAAVPDAAPAVDAGVPDATPPPDTMPGSPDASGNPSDPDDGGCGCRATNSEGSAAWLLLMAAWLLIGRGRRRTPWLGVATALLAACSGGGGDATPDAQTDATTDATTDAGDLADATWDAGPADAGKAGILVRVVDGEQPVPGVAVLFHDAEGGLLARGETAGDGELIADVPDGSMVTVVKRSAPVWLRTVRGAERGDVLVFGRQHRPVVDGSITVSLPAHPAPPEHATYTVGTHCGVAASLPGGPATLPLQMWCMPAPRSSVLAVLGTVPPGQQYGTTAYIEAQDVALVPGTTVTLSGPWSPAVMQSVAVTGVPVDATFHVSKTWYRGGLPFFTTAHRLSTPGSFPVPGGGDAWRVMVSMSRSPPTVPGWQYWYQWLTDPLVISGDFDAARLPWITSTTVDLGLRTQASWTTDRVVPYTGTKVRVLQLDDDTLLAEWTTVLPAATTVAATIVMPELPDDLVDLWVDLGALQPVTRSMVELDRTVALSYRDLRQGVFHAELTPGFALPESELSAVSVSDDIWWDQVPDEWP